MEVTSGPNDGGKKSPEPERYRAIFERAGNAILVADDEGRYIDANPAACELLGVSRSEILDKTIYDFSDPSRMRSVEKGFAQFKSAKAQSGEFELLRPDGRRKTVSYDAIADFVPGLHLSVLKDIGDEKRTSEALQKARQISDERETEFRVLTNVIPHMVWIADAGGAVIYSNKVVFEYTGFPETADQMALWSKVIQPDDFARISVIWRESFSKGEPFMAEYRIKNARGEYRWHLVRTSPLKDASGGIIKWFGTATDIQIQKEVQERQKFLAEAGVVLSSSLDYPETLKSLANLAVARLCDWCGIDILEPGEKTPRQIAVAHPNPGMLDLARDFSEKYPTDWNAPTGAPNVIRTGKPELYPEISDELLRLAAIDEDHLRMVRQLGMRSIMIVPLRSRGKVLGAITFIAAETTRHYTQSDVDFAQELADRAGIAIENALLFTKAERSEKQLKITTDMVPALISYLDASLTFRFINQAYEKLFKKPASEILGKPVGEVIGKDAFEKAKPYYQQVLSGKTVSSENALKIQGQEVYTSATYIPDFDENGRVRGFAALVTDITRQKQNEIEISRALQARDEFISIASHELKTPIAAMKLQTQMLERSLKRDGMAAIGPAKLQSLIDVSTRQLARLHRLVEDMLDVSRIATGRLSMQKEDVDLGALLQDTLERMSGAFQQAGCTLETHLETNVVGNFDRIRIEQVVINLLTNALKYAAGSPVIVKLEKGGDTAKIEVKDFGPGIPKSQHEMVFQRFERAVSGNNISGLGLGLYISKQIVEMHGGRIWVESEEGKGAAFAVELPSRRQ